MEEVIAEPAVHREDHFQAGEITCNYEGIFLRIRFPNVTAS